MANYTQNYQLHQWAPQDPFLRTDFNQDLFKLDEALNGLATKDGVLQAAINLCGNCEMELVVYTGTGTYGMGKPTKISFVNLPDIFMIVGDESIYLGRSGITTSLLVSEDFLSNTSCTWSETQVSIYNTVKARFQMNSQNVVYWAMGLRIKAN